MGRIDIELRRFRPDDVGLLYEAACESIAEVYPFMEWCHPGYSLDEAFAWVHSREAAWQAKTGLEFVIVERGSQRFLGGVGLNQLNHLHRFANLGYWVRTSAAGRGVATAATRACARFGLDELGLNRIEILVALGNRASQRVAERAGATREGVLRQRMLLHGRPADAVLYSLVDEDFEADRSLDTERARATMPGTAHEHRGAP
jgi:ribosomal-protein-serine acetyltransferase